MPQIHLYQTWVTVRTTNRWDKKRVYVLGSHKKKFHFVELIQQFLPCSKMQIFVNFCIQKLCIMKQETFQWDKLGQEMFLVLIEQKC